MNRQVVNRAMTALILAGGLTVLGIAAIGYAHETNVPHFHDQSTTRAVAENTASNTNIGSPVSAHTSRGMIVRYVLGGTDAGSFGIDSHNGQLKTQAALHFGTKNSYTVEVKVQQGLLWQDDSVTYVHRDSITVTINVTADGDTPSSSPGEADALPGVSSEERARIAAALAMDRVIFNELRNSTTDTHDWIELRNISDADITLDGWEVRIIATEGTGVVTFPAGTVLPAGELLLLVNTDPDAPEMPLSIPEGNVVSLVDAGLILPQTNFTLLLRSDAAWEDSVGNYFFGYDVPPTAPPLTTDAAWYRARPDVLGYQSEAWITSGYQEGLGYDDGVAAASALGTPGYPQASLVGDVNGDGTVNILDLVSVASRFGETAAPEADVNGDGTVNTEDLVAVANSFGNVAAAPSAQALHASHVQQWVTLAKQMVAESGIETSVAVQPYNYERGIQVLEQLLATLVPQSTALLANYPNPFNPETWIPYRLATGSDVQLRIYDTHGQLVRHLEIGHQAAGVYQTRSRAAYWDGRNALGEAVASGLYFYTLTAGDFSATRRMLILK